MELDFTKIFLIFFSFFLISSLALAQDCYANQSPNQPTLNTPPVADFSRQNLNNNYLEFLPDLDLLWGCEKAIQKMKVISASVEPKKVRPGDKMILKAKTRSELGIKNVKAEMPHENGYDIINLGLTEGSIYEGTWTGKWTVHDTKTKNYTTEVLVRGIEGNEKTAYVNWIDPNPPNVSQPLTFNSTYFKKEEFTNNQKVVIRSNITDIDGASDIDTVLINIRNATRSGFIIDGVMSQISSITNGYTYEYNVTLPPERNFGTWSLNIEANDSSGETVQNSEIFSVKDIENPKYRNTETNDTDNSIPSGKSIELSSEIYDGSSGLARAWLQTNETGTWKNYTRINVNNFVRHDMGFTGINSTFMDSGDLDSDGDLDLAVGTGNYLTYSPEVWYENLNGDTSDWSINEVVSSKETYIWELDVDDINEDGTLDIVIASYDFWYRKNRSGYVNESVSPLGRGVYAIDFDRDGDIDILSSSDWYENDGSENWQKHAVSQSDTNTGIRQGDIDGDGDYDAVTVSDNYNDAKSRWYENLGNCLNWQEHEIRQGNYNYMQSALGDINGDGYIDVAFATEADKDFWCENNGTGNFTCHNITGSDTYSYGVKIADMDKDGDNDLVYGYSGKDRWFENLDGNGTSWSEHRLDSLSEWTMRIDVADLDGDQDLDIGTPHRNVKDSWYESNSSWEIIHDSPKKLGDLSETWTWVNFTWKNESINEDSTIGWRIFFEDAHGNVNSTTIRTFNVLIPPDQPDLNSPEDGSIIGTPNPTLNVTVTDPDGDDMDVSFYNASSNSIIGWDNNTANGTSATYTWSDLSDGFYEWYSVADDGNLTTQSNTWNFTVDTKAPNYLLYSNSPGESVAEGDFANISVFWNDTYSYLDTGELLHNSSEVMEIKKTQFLSGSESWYNTSIDTSGLGRETICWKQYANDTLGHDNETMSNNCFYVNVPPDQITTPNNPSDGASDLSTSQTLNVTPTDPDDSTLDVIFYKSDGTEIATNTGVSNNTPTAHTWSDLNTGTTYNWYVNVTDGLETTQSSTWSFTTNYAPSIDSTTEPLDPSIYSPGAFYIFKANITDQDGASELDVVFFEWNGTNYTATNYTPIDSDTREYNYTLRDLSAQTNTNYRWHANESSDEWVTGTAHTFTISKATPSLSLSCTDVTYPTNPSCSASESNTGDSDLTYNFHISSLQEDSGSSISWSEDKAANIYNVEYNTTGGTNYSSTQSTTTVTVSEGTPSASLTNNETWIETYPTPVSIGYSESNVGDSDVTYKVWRDGVDKGTSEDILLGANTYDYKVNITAGTNWTAISSADTNTLTIDKGTLSGSTTASDATYPSELSVSSFESNVGDSDVEYRIYCKSIEMASSTGSAPSGSKQVSADSYTCKLNTTSSTFGNWSTSSSIATDTATISKATLSATITNNVTWTETYPTPVSIGYSESNVGDSDVTYKIYRNTTDIGTSEDILLGADTYSYVLNSTGGTNYSTNSSIDSNLLTITQANSPIYITANESSPITYETPINVTGYNCPSQSTCTLYRNDTGSIGSGSPQQNNILLGANSYKWTYNTSGSQNYTSNSTSFNLLVNKKDASVSVSPTTQTVTYTHSVIQYCTDSSTIHTCSLYRNDSSITNDTSINLTAGLYLYKANITDTANYTNYEDTSTLTINKATPSASLTNSDAWTVTYPEEITIGYSETNSGDEDVTYKVWRDGEYKGTSETIILGVDTYDYKVNSTESENYTSSTSLHSDTLTVNENTPSLSLTVTNTTYPDTGNITASESNTGDSDCTYNLYIDGVLETSGSTIDLNKDLGADNYTITYNTTGGANWSSSTTSKTLEISKGTPSATITNNVTWTETYPTPVSISYTESNNGDSDVTYKVWRDSEYKGASEDILLGANIYDYKVNSTSGTNWTSVTSLDSNILTINQGVPDVKTYINGFSSNKTVTYPAYAQVKGSSFTTTNPPTFTLYLDTYSNSSNPATLNKSLSKGTYNVIYNTTGNTNWTTASNTSIYLTVDKKIPSGDITGSNVTYPTSVNINSTETNTGDGDVNYTLWRNGTLINSSIGLLNYTDSTNLGAGTYVYLLNTTGGTNYTSTPSISTLNVVVNRGSPSLSLSCSNSTYPSNPSCSASEPNTGDSDLTYNFYIDNSLKDSGSSVTWSKDMAADIHSASYNTTGGDNWTSSQNTTSFNISKATLSATITNNETWIETYPTPVSIGYTESNNGDSDVTYKIYRNTTDIGTSEDILLGADTYSYVLNSTGGTNYSTNSSIDSNLLTINKATPSGYQTSNPSWTVTYPNETTVTCHLDEGDTGASLTLKRDGISRDSGTNPSETTILGYQAGGHSYTCQYPQTENYTSTTLDTDSLTVNKGTPSGSLISNPSWTVTYPEETNITGNESQIGDSDVTYYLYRNDTGLVEHPSDISTLGFGSYEYIYNCSSGENWTSVSSLNSSVLTVQQNQTNPVDIYLKNGTTYKNQNITITYGTETTANATAVYDNSGSANLYRDGSSVPNPETLILSGGYHEYKGNITGNPNYTDNSTGASYFVNVNQAEPSCSLSSNSTWSYTYEDPTTLTCTCSGDGIAHLYFDGSQKDSYNDTSIVFSAGDRDVVCNTTATENYTSSEDSSSLIINKKEPFLSLISNCTWTGTEYENVCNQTGYVIEGDSSATKTLYRNNSQVSNPNTIRLAAGSYYYNYTYEESENYTFENLTKNLVIEKKNANVIVYPQNQTINYGSSASQYCLDDSSLFDCSLYRNETDITNNTEIILASGVYQYKTNITDSENYTNYENISFLVVNKGTLNLSLSGEGTWMYPYESSIQGLEVNQGDDDVTYELWRNDTKVDNSKPYWDNKTLGAGNYKYKFNSTGGENWTENKTGVTIFVNITKNSSTQNFINLTINGTESDKEYEITSMEDSIPVNITAWFDSSSFVGQPPLFSLYNNTTILGSNNPQQYIKTYSKPATIQFVYNTSGNQNYSSSSKQFFLTINDTVIPKYSQDQDDSQGSIESGGIVNVSVYWEDVGSLNTIQFYHNASGVMNLNKTCHMPNNSTGWCNKTINTSSIPGKNICWRQSATDNFNNQNSTMNNTTHCFYVEFAPVSIDISNPTNTTYYSMPIDLDVTTNPNASWCAWNLNQTNNTTMNGSRTTWWDSINSSLGTHHLFVYCNNTDGSKMSSNSIYFSYQTPSGSGGGDGGGAILTEESPKQNVTNNTLEVYEIDMRESEREDVVISKEWNGKIKSIDFYSNNSVSKGRITITKLNETLNLPQDNRTEEHLVMEIKGEKTEGINKTVILFSLDKEWVEENSVENISFATADPNSSEWKNLEFRSEGETDKDLRYSVEISELSGYLAILGKREIKKNKTRAKISKCGNLICEEGENPENCPEDCESPEKNFPIVLTIVISFVLLVTSIFLIIKKKTGFKFKDKVLKPPIKTLKIEDILSKPQKYIGKKVRIKGVLVNPLRQLPEEKKALHAVSDETGGLKGLSKKSYSGEGTVEGVIKEINGEIYIEF